MPYLDRKTICVSTMVGCPAKCAFCATGAMGFGRNLTPGEIVGQILAVAGDQGIAPRELRNLVFMGMGEPLLNYDHTIAGRQASAAPARTRHEQAPSDPQHGGPRQRHSQAGRRG